ncbi:hypothetical protein EC912_103379 [Luteibacter rhizovicinus]|uniref:Uncharacterized protein n=1 Tax=Luteibacter rhizovicinus TaxID=242606 RepID=A0A4R3YR25_9GAMM|nr:hypothetical protein [Luteibacter rhizovicinus]TCV94890.1 hypothetical protein EC912_103379 [Luteibacter rhizovicinus]
MVHMIRPTIVRVHTGRATDQKACRWPMALLTLCLTLAATTASATDPEVSDYAIMHPRELEAFLSSKLTHRVKHQQFEGKKDDMKVHARLEVEHRTLYIDLDESLGPLASNPGVTELRRVLAIEAEHVLAGDVDTPRILFEFGHEGAEQYLQPRPSPEN